MTQVDPFALRRIQVLDSLNAPELEGLAKHVKPGRFVDGARICIEGQEDDRCFFLMNGHVRVSKDLGDGRLISLFVLREGTLFGQSGLIEGQRRTARVTAIGDVDVYWLERATLDWALERKQSWAVATQRVLAVSLMRLLRQALHRFAEISELEQAERSELIEGEAVANRRDEAVYLNLSGSFAELPSASSSSGSWSASRSGMEGRSGSGSYKAASGENQATHHRKSETDRLYEILQVVSHDNLPAIDDDESGG